ncbi:hypothetical protein ACVBIL_14980 [Shewanella sp. 125m-7]
MTGPLYDVHVTAAFVNPFTSDVIAELTGIVLAASRSSIYTCPAGGD